jgi:hypothetical protein
MLEDAVGTVEMILQKWTVQRMGGTWLMVQNNTLYGKSKINI